MDHNNYTYTYQPRQRSPSTASAKSNGAYQNSSAFSASANPDEDWTKISDLAERRRIQNRIAQRNYRKKLKRRLEDLERRTTSSSASPEQSHRELVQTPANDLQVPASHQMQRRVSAPRAGLISHEQQYSADIMPSGETWMNQAANLKPAFSFSAPSTYSYPETYSQPEYFGEDYGPTTYARLPMMYTNPAYSAEYAQSISPPLPPVLPSENFKPEPHYTSGELLTPFNMNYASLAGFNMSAQQGSSGVNTRTPPLTASSLYFDTSDYSPPQFTLPMTPESRSASPNIALFEQLDA